MIDDKLLEFFQWIVDESEHQPAWWVEQTSWAFVAADVVAATLTWKGWWSMIGVLITLTLAASMIFSSKFPALFTVNASGAVKYRLAFLAFTAFDAVSLMVETNAGHAAKLLSSVLLVACYYFAACQPPRPRKRTQAITQGGAV